MVFKLFIPVLRVFYSMQILHVHFTKTVNYETLRVEKYILLFIKSCVTLLLKLFW